MQKTIFNKIIWMVIIAIAFSSCGGFRYTLISKAKGCKISYIDSKKIGKRVNVELIVNNNKSNYNIYLGYKGIPIHIIKIIDKFTKKNDGIDDYRSFFLLVTDTLNDDPSYVGNKVNGYYQMSIPYPNMDNAKKTIVPIDSIEYAMLKKVKSLLDKRNVEFQIADSSKILGWFQYKL